MQLFNVKEDDYAPYCNWSWFIGDIAYFVSCSMRLYENIRKSYVVENSASVFVEKIRNSGKSMNIFSFAFIHICFFKLDERDKSINLQEKLSTETSFLGEILKLNRDRSYLITAFIIVSIILLIIDFI